MDNTLFRFAGANIGRFYIPPFTVSPGEVVIIGFPGGPYFMETVRLMVPQLQEIYPFTYAKKIGPRSLWHKLIPETVQSYVTKNGNPYHPIIREIYQLPNVYPHSDIHEVNANDRAIIQLCCALSLSNVVMADFQAVGVAREDLFLELVTQQVQRHQGAALLFDECRDLQHRCTRFITAEYLGDTL
ncbi:hypothetical protein FHW36_103101 [Chitinophaga polysaccharea]|uniref:ABC transporter family protein n=1 Tax=Chitinophaga polysaccharea TaxID=1293035 RepID=A0A561PT41_9BACT|nr:hypothetical protein [Chitinophaga polysaccharea]TWF41297.1 hypothetical protein FHW36_103101 [Chitinophaga polysaccharea]